MSTAPRAPRLAEALIAVNQEGRDAARLLADAVDIDEEVLVPLAADRATPLALGDRLDARYLVAFTSLDRVRHAMPDAPPIGVVGVRQVLGWSARFTTPVRLDATSPAEVRVSPEAAVALAEGRAAPEGTTFAGGGSYDPPRAEVDIPRLPEPDPDQPPGHLAASYGAGWRPGSTRLDEPLDAAEAQRRHLAGEPYLALVPRRGLAPVVVEVTPQRVTSRFLDADGRDDLVLSFSAHDGVLFQDELVVRSFDAGAPPEAPSSTQILRFAPDGTQRLWLSGTDGEQSIDQYGVDVSGHWERIPRFGNYDGVLNPDR